MMTESPPERASRPRSRVRYNAAMKILRRAHMYAGLSLTPFVLLYGASAFLFNHPDWFSDRSVRLITAGDVAGTPLGSFPTAEALASRVVEALNAESSSRIRLSSAQTPAYSRDLALTARTAGAEQLVFVELEGRVGTVRSAPASKVEEPGWSREVHLGQPPAATARDAVASILAKWGRPPSEVKVRTAPELIFAAEDDHGAWRVAYNLQTQALTVRPLGSDLSTRRFLTGLHLACRYPSQLDVRWVWALIVDVMAAGMVFWGVSGMLMWWQMKSLRRLGALIVAISLAATVLIAVGMHGVLAR